MQYFADRFFAERGVRYGRVAMIPTSAKMKRRPKAYLTIETPVVACPVRERTRLQSRCGGPSAAPFALGLCDLQRRG